ncbi:MAG: L-lactate permease [Propionivibrio sp.]|uniref:L-lactate permease n=1 Tax=Propionivibrio sp. TaxID=2212460 RepID=UPI001A446618|nr:L-lactate permease [Propionivibrio sp.]MBL8415691.1 L-lactate permease [Propionivibrio sp.]
MRSPQCNQQAISAQPIGIADALLVATSTSGGYTGRMISPHLIAVATAAMVLVQSFHSDADAMNRNETGQGLQLLCITCLPMMVIALA